VIDTSPDLALGLHVRTSLHYASHELSYGLHYLVAFHLTFQVTARLLRSLLLEFVEFKASQSKSLHRNMTNTMVTDHDLPIPMHHTFITLDARFNGPLPVRRRLDQVTELTAENVIPY
jgi:hypothetical protein